jgi:hypothetical protein
MPNIFCWWISNARDAFDDIGLMTLDFELRRLQKHLTRAALRVPAAFAGGAVDVPHIFDAPCPPSPAYTAMGPR